MRKARVIIIGAGQAGLAMSHYLSQASIDHVLLERGAVANSWRTERWDSLRLLTPNWQSRLPGYTYTGSDPDGFRTMPETINFLDDYAQKISAPIETRTEVLTVSKTSTGYKVLTNRDEWSCRCLVIASGACNIANIPKAAESMPGSVQSLTPMNYRNPQQLRKGGVLVVGASATGVQLAKEIQASGRQVTIAVGEHVRVPRMYRGRDIKWWMDAAGILDMGLSDVDDVRRVRNVPSLQLIGSPLRETIDLNSLQADGVRIAGRVMDISGDRVRFSGSLSNVCALADLKMKRLLSTIDAWAEQSNLEINTETAGPFAPTRLPEQPTLEVELASEGIETVIWSTGYRPDYSWLDVPVLDRKGHIQHRGGIIDAPGLYVLGLPFLRRRNSTLIDGVGKDARHISTHLESYLTNAATMAA